MKPYAGAPLRFSVQRQRVYNLSAGGEVDAVRVSYKVRGEKKWVSFIVVVGPGESVDDLMGKGFSLAQRHLADRKRLEAARERREEEARREAARGS